MCVAETTKEKSQNVEYFGKETSKITKGLVISPYVLFVLELYQFQ